MYAEALNVDTADRADLFFLFMISDQSGRVIMSGQKPSTATSADSSYAAWQYFQLPANLQAGIYRGRVDVLDHKTGKAAFRFVTFTVASS